MALHIEQGSITGLKRRRATRRARRLRVVRWSCSPAPADSIARADQVARAHIDRCGADPVSVRRIEVERLRPRSGTRPPRRGRCRFAQLPRIGGLTARARGSHLPTFRFVARLGSCRRSQIKKSDGPPSPYLPLNLAKSCRAQIQPCATPIPAFPPRDPERPVALTTRRVQSALQRAALHLPVAGVVWSCSST